MAETFDCPRCNNTVKITGVSSHPDYIERILSCGHTSRLFVRAINEPAINVSDTITTVVSRFKQSQKVIVQEKSYSGVPNLEFSGDNVKFIINNSTININTPDTKVNQNISTTNIIDKIQTLIEEVKVSSINFEEKEQILSLIESIRTTVSPGESMKTTSKFIRFKEIISRKKWVFPMATPFILKIIEVLTGK